MTHPVSAPRPSSAPFLFALIAVAGVLVALGLLVAPAPAHANTCTATNDCGSFPSVSCSGSSSCLIGSDYVECDGQRTYCQQEEPCSVQYTCPSPPYSQSFVLFCSSSTGPCSVNPFRHSVICDSTVKTCDECEALASNPFGMQCLTAP